MASILGIDTIQHQSGTTAMSIDNGGNVGIGITDPDSELHIYKADSATGCMLTIESDGGGGSSQPYSGILFKSNDGNPPKYFNSIEAWGLEKMESAPGGIKDDIPF